MTPPGAWVCCAWCGKKMYWDGRLTGRSDGICEPCATEYRKQLREHVARADEEVSGGKLS